MSAAAMHRTVLDVRWRDLDSFDHVNNSTYLTYVEEARLDWLRALPGPWVGDGRAPVLAAIGMDFRRPILWPARIVVELSPIRVGNSSLTLGHRILSEADASVVHAEGTATLVWIDTATGASAALPDNVRQAATR